MTSTRFADALKSGIRNSELTVFETCAHSASYEQAGEFNEKTLASLKRHSGQRSRFDRSSCFAVLILFQDRPCEDDAVHDLNAQRAAFADGVDLMPPFCYPFGAASDC